MSLIVKSPELIRVQTQKTAETLDASKLTLFVPDSQKSLDIRSVRSLFKANEKFPTFSQTAEFLRIKGSVNSHWRKLLKAGKKIVLLGEKCHPSGGNGKIYYITIEKGGKTNFVAPQSIITDNFLIPIIRE